MAYTLEQVDRIKSRMQVTYQEAKNALEQAGGDEVEAMILLEQAGVQNKEARGKHKAHHDQFEKFTSDVTSFVKRLQKMSFNIKKGDKNIVNLPLTIMILLTAFLFPYVVLGLVIGWATGFQFEVKRPKEQEVTEKPSQDPTL